MRVKNESAFRKQNRNRHLTGVKLARIVVKMSFVFVIVKDFHPWTFRVSFQRVVDISILLYARTQVFFFLSRWTNTLSIKKTKTKTQHCGKKINTSKNLQIQSNSKLKRTEFLKNEKISNEQAVTFDVVGRTPRLWPSWWRTCRSPTTVNSCSWTPRAATRSTGTDWRIWSRKPSPKGKKTKNKNGDWISPQGVFPLLETATWYYPGVTFSFYFDLLGMSVRITPIGLESRLVKKLHWQFCDFTQKLNTTKSFANISNVTFSFNI